jgi:hypothetical protein
MKAPRLTITKIQQPKPTINTVTTPQGVTEYQIVYMGSTVATVGTQYEAQRYIATIVDPINPV